LDAINRALLDRIQRSFPLVSEPYRVLSEGLGITEEEVRGRIGLMKEKRLLRQISAIFNTGALGYRSSLVAMAVPESHLDEAASVINQYLGVSHNYARQDAYSMWYTIAVPPGRSLDDTVGALSKAAGGWPTLILPAIKKYKLAVVLDVLEDGESGEGHQDLPRVDASDVFRPTDENIRRVRCIQEDLPLVEKPFGLWAAQLEMSEEALLDLVESWVGGGIMRRFAAVLNHREVGFEANGMVVWKSPLDRIDECGRTLAAFPEVSHLYYRPSHPEWPYNLYAMVHGRKREDCEKTVARLGDAIHLHDYRILFSTREFKKIRLKLFWD
jgi:DNA-binding Lrp family transcriptional regulator